MRKRTRPANDRKIFKRTGATTKRINVKPSVARGGIRM